MYQENLGAVQTSNPAGQPEEFEYPEMTSSQASWGLCQDLQSIADARGTRVNVRRAYFNNTSCMYCPMTADIPTPDFMSEKLKELLGPGGEASAGVAVLQYFRPPTSELQ